MYIKFTASGNNGDFSAFANGNDKVNYFRAYHVENTGIHGGVNIPLPENVKRDSSLPRGATTKKQKLKKAPGSSSQAKEIDGISASMTVMASQGEDRNVFLKKQALLSEYNDSVALIRELNEQRHALKKQIKEQESQSSDASYFETKMESLEDQLT